MEILPSDAKDPVPQKFAETGVKIVYKPYNLEEPVFSANRAVRLSERV